MPAPGFDPSWQAGIGFAVSSNLAKRTFDDLRQFGEVRRGSIGNFRFVNVTTRLAERLGAGSPGSAGEDMDLLYRLLRAGARIRYEPEALVFHERQPRERRLASRSAYGRGVGACCGLWLRGRDLHAIPVLGGWLRMRAGMAAGAVRRRQWESLREEMLVLGGTARGLIYGLRSEKTA